MTSTLQHVLKKMVITPQRCLASTPIGGCKPTGQRTHRRNRPPVSGAWLCQHLAFGLLAPRSAREHFSVVRSYSLQYFVTAPPRLRQAPCPTSNPLSPLPRPLLNSHSGGVFLHVRFYGYKQEGHFPLMSGLSNDKDRENQPEALGSCWKKQGFTNHTENPRSIAGHRVSALTGRTRPGGNTSPCVFYVKH